MKHTNAKKAAQKILAHSDVQINGSRPWDIQVNNPNFYSRVLAGCSLALGESYMDGWWSCRSLDQLFDRILSARLDKKVKKEKQIIAAILRAKIRNVQSRSRRNQLWQIVFSQKGIRAGYQPKGKHIYMHN